MLDGARPHAGQLPSDTLNAQRRDASIPRASPRGRHAPVPQRSVPSFAHAPDSKTAAETGEPTPTPALASASRQNHAYCRRNCLASCHRRHQAPPHAAKLHHTGSAARVHDAARFAPRRNRERKQWAAQTNALNSHDATRIRCAAVTGPAARTAADVSVRRVLECHAVIVMGRRPRPTPRRPRPMGRGQRSQPRCAAS